MRKLNILCAIALILTTFPLVGGKSVEVCEWTCYMMNPQHNAIVPENCGVDPSKTDLLWQKCVGDPANKCPPAEEYGRSIEAPAVYSDGYVYYGRMTKTAHETYTSKFIKADANTGNEIWEFTIDNANPNTSSREFFVSGISASPVIFKDKVYICSVNSDVYCINTVDGSLVWKSKNSTPTRDKNHDPQEGSYIRSSPVIYNNQLLVAISFGGKDTKYNMKTGSFDIYAFDTENGENKRIISTDAYYYDKQTKDYIPPDPMAMRSSVTVSGDNLLVSSTIAVTCFDLKTNNQKWRLAANAKHPYFCTPSVVDGFVYYGGPDKDFYCVDLEKGGFEWSSESKYSIRNAATPLVTDGKIFIAGRAGKFYCLNKKNGIKLWDFQTKDTTNAICSSPVYCEGKIWFGSNDHYLYCLDGQTGKVIKSIELDGEIIAPPVIIDKKLFIGTEKGTFYCFGEKTESSISRSVESSQGGSDTWTTFMGDNERTGFAQKEAGPKTDQLEKYWEFPTGFRVIPSVMIAEGKAFVGSQDNWFRAVNLADGLELWRTKCGEKCHHDKHVTIDELKYGGVISTPVYNDGKLYFGTICYKVLCMDAKSGSIVWEYDDPDRDESFNCSMLLYKDRLYTVSAEKVYCLDMKTGKKLWMQSVWSNIWSAPMIANGKLYVAGLKNIRCFDPMTGDELIKNSFVFDGKNIEVASPSFKDNKVYFGCMDSDFMCFEADTGKEVWRNRDERAITCPALTDDKIIFGDLFKNVSCLDRATGKKLWKFEADDYVYGAPVFCGDKVYFGSSKGSFYCVETKYGKLVWKYNVKESKWQNPFAQAFACSPSVAGGKVYVGGVDGNVYCFGDLRKGMVLDHVKVTAPSNQVMVNGDLQLKAIAYAKDNSQMNAEFEWTAEPDTLGIIDPDGLFMAGKKPGSVYIKACTGGKCDGVKIDIKELKDLVASVSIQPKSANVIVGEKKTFVATAFDGAGNPIDGVEFTWKVEPSNLGTVDNGEFIATKSGKGRVTATIGARTATATFVAVKPSKVTINPQSATVVEGQTQQFTAKVFDDTDDVIEESEVTWKVDPETLGTISTDGLFIAKTQGTGSVIAQFGNLSATASVTVSPTPKADIVFEPKNLDFGELQPDQPKSLTIKIRNSGDAKDSVNISSDSDWLKVEPGMADLDGGSEIAISVTAMLSGKTRGQAYNGVVTIKTSADEYKISATAIVAMPSACLTVSVNTFGDKVPANVVEKKQITITNLKTGNLTVKVNSTNPKVVPVVSSLLLQKSVVFEFNVNTAGLTDGELIEGTLDFTTSDDCQPLIVPFSLTVVDTNVKIWLQIGNRDAKINDKPTQLSVPPQILKGSTVVPLRFIGEAFGCQVNWNAADRSIILIRGDFRMMLKADDKTADVNGKTMTMSVPPTIIKSSVVVPMRFIAESFGAKVDYNAETKEIMISWTPSLTP